MANLSLLGLWLHWTASVEHRQYCRLIIWKYLVAALVPVSEEVCRSVDVYQRGKLLTLELKTGTLLKLGVRFKVTLVVVNLLWNIGNVIWVEAYHYWSVRKRGSERTEAGESALPAEESPSAGTGRARTLRILQENSIDFITGAGEENHSTCRGLNPLTPTWVTTWLSRS